MDPEKHFVKPQSSLLKYKMLLRQEVKRPSEGWSLAAPREIARTLKGFQGTQVLGRQAQNAMERISTPHGLPALGLLKRSDAGFGNTQPDQILHTSNYFMICTHCGGCFKAVLLIHRFSLFFCFSFSCQLAELAATWHLGRPTVTASPPASQTPTILGPYLRVRIRSHHGGQMGGGGLVGACSPVTKYPGALLTESALDHLSHALMLTPHILPALPLTLRISHLRENAAVTSLGSLTSGGFLH